MKRTFIISFMAVMALMQSSCKKYLEQTSQDLIRPVTITHYKELLQGEGYFKDLYARGWFIDVMTDNIAALDLIYPTTGQNTKAKYAGPAYKWAADLEEVTGTFSDRLFQHLYKNILAANTCIQAGEKAEGTATEKAVLMGQAYFHRAYGYFTLANLYAQAHNEAQPDDLCVPLILETTPSLKTYNRATIKEVWDLIKADITKAVELLSTDNATRTVYEVNYKAALVLASRISLYMEDYEQVIKYGEKFLVLNPALRNITAITTSPTNSGAFAPGTFLMLNNPEIVFTFGTMNSSSVEGSYMFYTRETTAFSEVGFSASKDEPGGLMKTYEATDRRLNHWFTLPTGAPGEVLGVITRTPVKVSFYDGNRFSQTMRAGEVYLNIAEAYARKASPDPAHTIELLNQLRRNRIAGYTDLTAAGFAGAQELVQFVWDERRRELCFEEFHRWWDLRRTGQPALQHDYLGDVFELKPKDPAYILNFPKQELEFNTSLVPNARPVRTPL